ncbi:MAG: hypothetical protein LCH54_08130 [Bacteroidetes bacterium]|nr:hypothetical protein [Bacteroidota bacterium]
MKPLLFSKTLIKALRNLIRYRKITNSMVLDYPPLRRWVSESSKSRTGLAERIQNYAVISLFIGENLCILRNSPMTRQEEKRILYFSASLPVFDDFFESENRDFSRILRLMNHPETIVPETPDESLFVQLITELIQNVPDPTLFRSWFLKLFESFRESEFLGSDSITEPDIERITWEKAAFSSLCIRALLDHQMIQGEEMAIFYQAGTIQFLDDIVDVYDDYHSGLHTLATKNPNCRYLRTRLHSEIKKTVKAFRSLSVNSQLLRVYFDMMSFAFSMGYVCLDQYEAVQGRSRDLNLSKAPRKKMKFSLSSPPNLFRAIAHSYRHPIR